MGEDPVLSIRNVSKSYHHIRALHRVSFDVQGGEVLALLGPNGSGKSTLVRMISLVMAPDEGSVSVLGETAPREQSIKKRIGVLFDHSTHWDSLSGMENAWFFAKSYGLSDEEAMARIRELAEALELWERMEDKVGTYSFGMRRKLAILEAVVHSPDLIVLDEPTMGLDFTSRLWLYNFIRRSVESGRTVILATNDINEASFISDRVALLSEGELLGIDDPRRLMGSIEGLSQVRIELSNPIDYGKLKSLGGVSEVGLNQVRDVPEIVILLDRENGKTPYQVLAQIVTLIGEMGGGIRAISIDSPDLGDIFLRMTGRRGI